MSAFDAFGNYAGLANAQNSFNQTQNFLNNQQQNMAGWNAQNAAATANLTQDPAHYAALGIAYQGQIGPVAAPGTYNGAWASRTGGAAPSSGGGDVWSQGADAVPYVNETQSFWDRYNAMRGGTSSFAPNSTYSPSQYTPTPQTPMSGTPSMMPGYDNNRFMPSSTAWDSYGQPGVGGASPSNNGVDMAAMWGYLQANPDVLTAAQSSGQDIFSFANQHLNQFGRGENRSLGDASGFDAMKSAYLQNNPDVAAAGMDAYQHWNQFGRNEGRDFGGGLVGTQGGAPASASGGVRDQIAEQMTFNDRWGNTPYIAGPGYKLPPYITDGTGNTGNTPFEQRWGDMDPNPDATPYPNSFNDRWGAVPSYDPNSFANRFGAGGYFQPGSPSQYYTGGEYGPAAQMPRGFNNGTYPGMPSRDTLGPGDYFPAPAGGQSYLQANPDVAASGMDPWQHYQQFGQSEGRSWPSMAMDDSSGMADFQSPANAYDTFQNKALKQVSGGASTYDPYHPGWNTGPPKNASGGTYDPNGYHAAIQTSLRSQFGGVPYGKQPGQALVQSPGGQQVIVDVNNVGPLTQGRVIDLSTKAMQYLNPSATPNSGLIPNTLVTGFPYGTSYPTGPTGPVGPYGPQQPTPGIPLPTYGNRPTTPTKGYW